jgi:hypothetical protein
MYTGNINNHSDDSLIHVFSTEGSRRVKNYKREKPKYKSKKPKKCYDKDKKENTLGEDATTIDIRC